MSAKGGLPKMNRPSSNPEMEARIRELMWTVRVLRKAIRAHLHTLLKGKEPEIQSAVVADLAATYLAGVAPQYREEFKRLLFQMIEELVSENERELFGAAGHPGGRICPDH